MGLLSIIKKTKQKEKEMRILILGLDNAGKTTVVKRFCNQDTSTISPTLGFMIHAFSFRGVTLNVWDIGGQQCLRSYWRNYFESTDGIIWVVDSNDQGRLQDCKRELQNLLQEERLAGATLLLFLNKQDIATALPPAEISEILDTASIASGKRHVKTVVCSARTGDGLLEGISWLVEDISSRIFLTS